MFDRLMSTNKAGGFGVGKTGFLQVLAFRRLSKLYLKRYIIFIQLFINSKIENYTIVTSGTIFFHYFVSESKYRISANSFRGNYSIYEVKNCHNAETIWKFPHFLLSKKNSFRGNYTRKYGTHMICYDHVLLYFFFQKHNWHSLQVALVIRWY